MSSGKIYYIKMMTFNLGVNIKHRAPFIAVRAAEENDVLVTCIMNMQLFF